jgi:hypothetical protein
MNGLSFHHIAIASSCIEKEYKAFEPLGYVKEGGSFIDEAQGVKGQFIAAEGQPRIELLENLENSHTLDVWLNNNIKMYHLAYYVKDFDTSIELFVRGRAKVIKPPLKSVYFGGRICFLVLSNRSIIELIEYPPPPPVI